MAQIRTVNKKLKEAGLDVQIEYGSSGRINYVNGGIRTYTGITWLNRLSPEQWVERAREFVASDEHDTAEKAHERLVYSSRSALRRGLQRKGIDINGVEIRETDDGKLEVTI